MNIEVLYFIRTYVEDNFEHPVVLPVILVCNGSHNIIEHALQDESIVAFDISETSTRICILIILRKTNSKLFTAMPVPLMEYP